ncbi:MAG: hypothetical protein VB099_20915 [Candidatus Limiplasma sp.]|nr:hypothetical protein [Candidatus Limiplasma sp.]
MKDRWAEQAERNMDAVQRQAQRRLKVIGATIYDAQTYLTEEAQRLVRTPAKPFGLAGEEARAELAKPISAAEYERLLWRLAAMPQGEERRRLTDRANGRDYPFRISRGDALRESIAIETETTVQVIENELTKQRRFTAKEAYARRLFSIQRHRGDL